MRLLLDSHVLLWSIEQPRRLGDSARRAIVSSANDVHVSVASIWELEIKRSAGKLAIGVDLVEDCEAADVALLPIGVEDALAAARLPLHHADRFDRMIVAQAQQQSLTLVTHDERLAAYRIAILEA